MPRSAVLRAMRVSRSRTGAALFVSANAGLDPMDLVKRAQVQGNLSFTWQRIHSFHESTGAGVSIFDPTAGNVGVVAQLASMTKLGKARTKFELFGDERTTDPRFFGGTSRPSSAAPW